MKGLLASYCIQWYNYHLAIYYILLSYRIMLFNTCFKFKIGRKAREKESHENLHVIVVVHHQQPLYYEKTSVVEKRNDVIM